MGDVIKFGVNQRDKSTEESAMPDDVKKGFGVLVDYLAVNRNISLDNSRIIIDAASKIADSAFVEGFDNGSVTWLRVLTMAVEKKVIDVDAYDGILEICIEMSGGNADEAE